MGTFDCFIVYPQSRMLLPHCDVARGRVGCLLCSRTITTDMIYASAEFSKQAQILLDFSSPKCYNNWVNKMKAFLLGTQFLCLFLWAQSTTLSSQIS